MTSLVNDRLFCGLDLEDYKLMFDLNDDDLKLKTLDCMGALSNFTLKMRKVHPNYVACDSLYELEPNDFENMALELHEKDKAYMINNKEYFSLTESEINDEVKKRKKVIDEVISSYHDNKGEGVYIPDSLPELMFKDQQFDLALCSHYLFTYEDKFNIDFYIKSFEEILRVATEIRVFPLVDKNSKLSENIALVIQHLQEKGYLSELRAVDFKLQNNSGSMLKVWNDSCKVK